MVTKQAVFQITPKIAGTIKKPLLNQGVAHLWLLTFNENFTE
jgi:hypothetical protein